MKRKRTGTKGEVEQGYSHILPDYFFQNIYGKNKTKPKLISLKQFLLPAHCKTAGNLHFTEGAW